MRNKKIKKQKMKNKKRLIDEIYISKREGRFQKQVKM